MHISRTRDITLENYGYYDGMIPKGCVTIIAGQGASGKSTLMCYLASTLERVAKTLIISNEEPEGIIASRVGQYSNVGIASFTGQIDNRKLTKDDLLEALEDYDLVFADSLITFNEDKDINKAGTAESFLTPFVRAVANSDRALVFLHHTNKGGGDSLQDIVSGSERLVSGVRHCKVVINDQMHGRRFLCVVKDNTNMRATNLEIIAEKQVFPDGGSMTVVKELVPTTIDMEKIIYENSKASKIRRWDKEIFAETKEQVKTTPPSPPVSIARVLLASNGEDMTTGKVRALGANEYKYFVTSVRKTGVTWVTKERDSKRVTYKWTPQALAWLNWKSEEET